MESTGKILSLDRSVPFVDAVFRVLERTGTEAEAAKILLEAESRHNVRFLTVIGSVKAKHLPDHLYATAEDHVHRFLTETHMVFTGYEYDQMDVLYKNYAGSWSYRAWGALVTRWANSVRWLGKGDWTYLDFYGGLNDRVVKNYLAWSEAMMQVVHTKCLLSQLEGTNRPLYRTAP